MREDTRIRLMVIILDRGKGVRAACALLRKCGFRRVCTYEKHQPVFHTLG